MSRYSFLKRSCFAASIVIPIMALAAELGTEAYRLVLVDPYAIYRSDMTAQIDADRGSHLLGLTIAFVAGLASPPRKSPIAVAVGIGLVTNVIAQVFIAGGGPGAFVGFVALPLLCIVAASLGNVVRGIPPADRVAQRPQ